MEHSYGYNTLISIFFVMRYASKVKKDKGSTFLSLREQKNAEKNLVIDAEKKKRS